MPQLGVDADRRFVEQEESRVVHHRARQVRELPLTAGELMDGTVHLVVDAEQIGQSLGALADR